MSKVFVEKIIATNKVSEDGELRWITLEVYTSDNRVQGMAFTAPVKVNFTVEEIAEGFRDFGTQLEDMVNNPVVNKDKPFAVREVLVTG